MSYSTVYSLPPCDPKPFACKSSSCPIVELLYTIYSRLVKSRDYCSFVAGGPISLLYNHTYELSELVVHNMALAYQLISLVVGSNRQTSQIRLIMLELVFSCVLLANPSSASSMPGLGATGVICATLGAGLLATGV